MFSQYYNLRHVCDQIVGAKAIFRQGKNNKPSFLRYRRDSDYVAGYAIQQCNIVRIVCSILCQCQFHHLTRLLHPTAQDPPQSFCRASIPSDSSEAGNCF